MVDREDQVWLFLLFNLYSRHSEAINQENAKRHCEKDDFGRKPSRLERKSYQRMEIRFTKQYKHKVLYFIAMVVSPSTEIIENKDMVGGLIKISRQHCHGMTHHKTITPQSGVCLDDFENRIKSILVDPGPEFLKNIQELAETIIFCRDRKRGCGQRDDAYKMLFIWYKYFPDWALRLFGRFVYGDFNAASQRDAEFKSRLVSKDGEAVLGTNEGVGSWADVKYLCGYLASIRCEDSFVSTCVENFTNALIDRMNTQIESDRLQWDLAISDYLEKRDIIFREGIDVSLPIGRAGLVGLPKRPRALETISMAVKWVPRESSKYRWLFEKMVLRWGRKYHANYFDKLDHVQKVASIFGTEDEFEDKENCPLYGHWNHQKRVLNKLSMMYRKMVAGLSREIVYDLKKNESLIASVREGITSSTDIDGL